MKLERMAKSKINYNSENKYVLSFYNICLFSIEGAGFVFNTITGAVILIDKNIWLEKKFNDNEKKILVENGFLVDSKVNEKDKFIKNISLGDDKINYFTIIPTTGCNARCFYCYEECYPVLSINDEVEDKIVEYIVSNVKSLDSFVLDWFGGEPLLSWKKIDSIIDKLSRKIELDKYDWSSVITTNSVLFDDELIEKAVNKWHLKVAHITVDGVEKEHNKRKNIVNKKINAFLMMKKNVIKLLDNGVLVNLRVHLDNRNRDSFTKILDEISEFSNYSNFRLFPTYLFPPEKFMSKDYINDSEKEDLFYDIFRVLMDKKYIDSYLDELPYAKKMSCSATQKNRVVISPDGKIHACVQEFIGDTESSDIKFKNYLGNLGECYDCVYFPLCLGGCIHNKTLKNTVRSACQRSRFLVKPLLKLELEKRGFNVREDDAIEEKYMV